MSLKIQPPTGELVDERSRNGTWVNGVRMAAATLQHGDRFGVGETELVFEVQEETFGPADIPSPEIDERISDPAPHTRVSHRRQNERAFPAEREPAPTTGPMRSEDGISRETLSFSEQVISTVQGTQIIGSYEIGEVLGSGGMAIVYKARHRRSGKEVALKLIRADLAKTKKRIQLFVREAGLLGQLKHPRIVEFHEFGIHEDRNPYLVMEYLETRDLMELVDGQTTKQRIRTSLWVVSRVLEALHYLHDQGIVHRDIKPGNILAFMEGHRLQVKLADFGLAKLMADAGISGVTSERSVRGTIAYMSPEQFRDSLNAGPVDDLYSCGATLYRMIVGEVPNMVFEPESTIGKFEAVSIPTKIRDLIEKSIALSPAERFQTVEEFVSAITRLKS